MKNWWINNSWRFWGWQWACGDEDSAFAAWQKYRHMLNPIDARSLVEMICDDYANDVDRAVFGNPVIRFVWWVRRLGAMCAQVIAKRKPPF